MKKVLITGVAGLIGSHLADSMLDAGYSVIGIDDMSAGRMSNISSAIKNERFEFKKSDISDKKALSKALKSHKFDVIVHMAASKKIGESGSSLKVLKNNVDSTVNMLDLAVRHKAKFVFASTSDVYGVSKDIPFSEDGNIVLGPSYIKRWSYAASKVFCEHLVFAYHQDYKLPVVVLRYFGCFSSRSNKGPSGGHIPLFIWEALQGETITIHGDGKQTRSMAYVDDIVKGTLKAIESHKAIGNIINIGANEEISVKRSAEIILKMAVKTSPLARRARIKYIPMGKVFGKYKEICRRIPDLKKAKKLLGYKPKINFNEAVKLTINGMLHE